MILAVVALCVYLLDQIAKVLVVSNLYEGQQVQVLGQLLQLHFVKNPGAAFSIGTRLGSSSTSIVAPFLCSAPDKRWPRERTQ